VKLELSKKIFVKASNIKFHENPSSGSRVLWGRANRHNEANSRVSQFCEQRLISRKAVEGLSNAPYVANHKAFHFPSLCALAFPFFPTYCSVTFVLGTLASVRTPETTVNTQNRFLWNFILGSFTKICRDISVRSDILNAHLIWKTHWAHLVNNIMVWGGGGRTRQWVSGTLIYEAVKRRFFFLSSHHLNDNLEGISIFYLSVFNSVTKENSS
jgi:hypothetical protein